MRKLGQDVRAAEKRITATTRQLESMIRLAEAHAKMRLSEVVTRADVLEAERLIQSALKTAATDSQGRIDMSLLTEGTSASERKRKAEPRREEPAPQPSSSARRTPTHTSPSCLSLLYFLDSLLTLAL